VQITSNDPATATVTLNLTGTGVVPPPAQARINLNPPALNFGAVNLGGSQTLSARIENLGGSDLNVTAITPCSGTSNEFSFTAPARPFTVASGASASVPVAYAPLAGGADTGCLQIASSDPANPTLSLAVSGTGATPLPTGAADPDVEHFSATSAVDICASTRTPVALRLEVENERSVSGSAPATLIGVQNGTEVYKQTITVSVRSRGDARFSFPSFTPTRTGTISWTVTIADQNSDVDVAKATTTVTCSRSGADGRERDEHDDEHDD
jgi:hypothetical protein